MIEKTAPYKIDFVPVNGLEIDSEMKRALEADIRRRLKEYETEILKSNGQVSVTFTSQENYKLSLSPSHLHDKFSQFL